MIPPLATRTVGVIGSGTDEHEDVASAVGRLLASLGVNLMTGGGRGVMTSVSRAFVAAARSEGICIGIIPCRSKRERTIPRDGYPNPFVELPIFTHLPYSGDRGTGDLSRNHIIILSCCAIVALPGGAGTSSEMSLAMRYGRPLVACSSVGEVSGVERFLRGSWPIASDRLPEPPATGNR